MFLCCPVSSSAFVRLGVESNVARVDVRAVYGGFNAGLAAYFAVCAARGWTVQGLTASLFAYGGLAAGRIAGLMTEGADGINAALFAGEASGVVLSYTLLRIEQGIRGMRLVKLALRLLLGIFFVLAGINHFVNPDFYMNIMPDYFPFHYALVLLSGVTEIVAGAMLFYGPTVRLGAWGIVAMLVIFFTVHIHMIVHADRYPNVPPWALWLRIVLQFVFIAWAWWYTRAEKKVAEGTSA